ncbi:hypothetical protein [Brevibacillus dissolubilis]|uniref:hypothetical protein n=1 Tax=Brevibacillus dissolubilis TaxID=1844116 RepID=UPI0011177A1A|nr:hypothetical protein [Brevibacillus dissolubilis]
MNKGSILLSATSFLVMSALSLGFTPGASVYAATGQAVLAGTEVAADEETGALSIDPASITVVNNQTGGDDIIFADVPPLTKIKVYDAQVDGSVMLEIGTGSYPGSLTIAEVIVDGIPEGLTHVYVTKTDADGVEGAPVAVEVPSYAVPSVPLDASQLSMMENLNYGYWLEVSNVADQSMIKVYDSAAGGNLLTYGQMTNASSTTLFVPPLEAGTAHVYVSVSTPVMGESARIAFAVPASN